MLSPYGGVRWCGIANEDRENGETALLLMLC